jgi:hypothetical protein
MDIFHETGRYGGDGTPEQQVIQAGKQPERVGIVDRVIAANRTARQTLPKARFSKNSNANSTTKNVLPIPTCVTRETGFATTPFASPAALRVRTQTPCHRHSEGSRPFGLAQVSDSAVPVIDSLYVICPRENGLIRGVGRTSTKNDGLNFEYLFACKVAFSSSVQCLHGVTAWRGIQ